MRRAEPAEKAGHGRAPTSREKNTSSDSGLVSTILSPFYTLFDPQFGACCDTRSGEQHEQRPLSGGGEDAASKREALRTLPFQPFSRLV